MANSVLEALAKELEFFFSPISERLRAGAVGDLLGEVGWRWPEGASLDAQDAVDSLDELVSELGRLTDDSDVPAYIEVFQAAVAVITALRALSGKLPDPSGFTGADRDALQDLVDNAQVFGERLVSLLIVKYLQTRSPGLVGVFQLVGVIRLTRMEPDGIHMAFERAEIEWGNLSKLLFEPGNLFGQLYGWGQGNLRAAELLNGLESTARGFGVPAEIKVLPPRLENALLTVLGQDPDDGTLGNQLEVPLFQAYSDTTGRAELGLRIVSAPGANGTGSQPRGILFVPFAQGTVAIDVAVTESLRVESSGSFDALFALRVLPEGQVTPLSLATGSTVDLSFGLRVSHGRPAEPLLILGLKNGSRVEYSNSTIRLGLLGSPADPEVFVDLSLRGLRIVIQRSDGDGFINNLLPEEPIVVTLDTAIGFSNRRGFYFGVAGGLEVTVPLHLAIGPITLESLYLALGISLLDEAAFDVKVGLSLGSVLGPVSASVKRIGVTAALTFPENGGNLGSADLVLGFLPPTGAGLSLNIAALTGGGFLDFDNDNKRYAGVLTLSFGKIGLTAIGLIATRMPDGSDGFSMLVNIGVIFNPPIPLSMGFTLAGVGGLIGVNRSMQIEVLQRGIRHRTLDSILFPDPATVIANASRIISDLEAVFPTAEGQFVVGPMVKIAYGTPTIVTADIGIFIELPDPVRIVLMGQVEAALPEPGHPVVVIHLDVLGVLDFAKEQLTFQASLYDSRVLVYPISGDAAFLLGWGTNRTFALSLGGFHPKFHPPPPPLVFAGLKRLSIGMSKGQNFELNCSSYHALTPNTLQFGARADLFASAHGVTVSGFVGFDVLISFSPFKFEAELRAGVSVKYRGHSVADVRLRVKLTGPGAWTARGKAKAEISCCPDPSIDFSFEWGRASASTLPSVDAWKPFLDALAEPGSWSGVLPLGSSTVEALRERQSEASGQIVVHPTGRLEVRQNVVPMAVAIETVSNAPVKGHDLFDIDALLVNGVEVETEPAEEHFARGQFEKLSDKKRLSVPAFERMQAGVRSTGATVRLDGAIEPVPVRYDSILIGEDRIAKRQATGGEIGPEVARKVLRTGAARRAAASAGPRANFGGGKAPPKISCPEERYCVAIARTLSRAQLAPVLNVDNRNLTRMAADQKLVEQIALEPGRASELIVVAEFEIQEAA